MKNYLIAIALVVLLFGGWYAWKHTAVTPGALPSATTTGMQGPTTTPSIKGPTAAPPTTTGAPKTKPTQTVSGSGIKGIVTIGPTCPAQPAYDPTGKCADKPFAGKFEIKSSIGTVVKTFSTGSAGTFSVSLPAGTYSIEPMPGTLYPRMIPANNILVKANQYTSVTVKFDTGIR